MTRVLVVTINSYYSKVPNTGTGTVVSMEEIYHHVLQFVYGTKNLWR